MTQPDQRFAVTVSLVKAGLYKRKIVRSTVVDSMDFELPAVQVQEVVDSFCADRGIQPPSKWERTGELRRAMLTFSENEADILEVLITAPVVPKTEQELELESIQKSEASAAAKTYLKWRVRLDALKKRQAEIACTHGELTTEQRAEAHQIAGAINILFGVLTDLQILRPVNKSALG